MLGITISNNLSWESHVRSIARSASQKLGFLFRAKSYFTPSQLLMIYKVQIRPVLEYCSHIWSAAPKHILRLLDSVQKRAIRLVGDASLTNSLTCLEHRRKVCDLSLFYRYFHGRCSSEISTIVPALAVSSEINPSSSVITPLRGHFGDLQNITFQRLVHQRTARLWNSLPREVFPEAYNLQKFKKNTNSYLLSLGSHDVL
ncbi:hypothetical protein JTB14_032816 [Gonioctena quinquepunctata]|nr:hypothetical protein JTB14_032816 [Gonioctena quinquepunctata]